jgi:hypothetical protein
MCVEAEVAFPAATIVIVELAGEEEESCDPFVV